MSLSQFRTLIMSLFTMYSYYRLLHGNHFCLVSCFEQVSNWGFCSSRLPMILQTKGLFFMVSHVQKLIITDTSIHPNRLDGSITYMSQSSFAIGRHILMTIMIWWFVVHIWLIYHLRYTLKRQVLGTKLITIFFLDFSGILHPLIFRQQ